MGDYLSEEFTAQLQNLVGKVCWAFYAGVNTGSHLSLHFGRKIPRVVPLLGNHLTEDQKYHSGELALYVRCAWRVDAANKVVFGSTDPNEDDGPMLAGLQRLVGQHVTGLQVFLPAFDLTVKFEAPFTLKIFCDQTDARDEYSTNYSFHSPDKIYVVGPRSQLRHEIPQRHP